MAFRSREKNIRHRASARRACVIGLVLCVLCIVFFENCQLGGPRIPASPCHVWRACPPGASIFSSWSLPRASWSLPGVFWALLEPQDAPKTPTRAAQERPRRPKTRQDGFFEPTWAHVGANMEPCWHQNRIPKVSYAKTA